MSCAVLVAACRARACSDCEITLRNASRASVWKLSGVMPFSRRVDCTWSGRASKLTALALMSGSDRSSGMIACAAEDAPENAVETALLASEKSPAAAEVASHAAASVVSAQTTAPCSALPSVCSTPASRPATNPPAPSEMSCATKM